MGISGHTSSAFLGGSCRLSLSSLGRGCALLPASLTVRAWVPAVPEGHCLPQRLRARRSWRASACDLSSPQCPPLAAAWGSGGSTGLGSSPQSKWCDLGCDCSPPLASVSSSCNMKPGQLAPSFRPHIVVYPSLRAFSHLYPLRRQTYQLRPLSPHPLVPAWCRPLIPRVISLGLKWSACFCPHPLPSGLFPEQIVSPCVQDPPWPESVQWPPRPLFSLRLHCCHPHPLLWSHWPPSVSRAGPSAAGPLYMLLLSLGSFCPDGHVACSPTILRSVHCDLPDHPI